MPACRCAADRVVERRRAEQQRAAHRDGQHERRARRREAARRRGEVRGRRGSRRPARRRRTAAAARPPRRVATIGPRQPTAMTRKIAVISDVAAAVAGVCVVAATAKSGTAPAIATSPPISASGAEPVAARRGVRERARRRHAGRAAARRQDREQRDARCCRRRPPRPPASGRRQRSRRGDPVAHEPVAREHGRASRRARSRRPSRGARRSSPPTRSSGGSGPASRRSPRSRRDLLLALLDGERHRAGDDEQRDEDAEPGERRGDGDQPCAARLELGRLRACRAPSPVSTTAPPAAARTRAASKPGPARMPIASTVPGWPASRARPRRR